MHEGTTLTKIIMAYKANRRMVSTLKTVGGLIMLVGGDGNETRDGGSGSDRMDGGHGDDLDYVDNAADRVFDGRGGGTDTVRATSGVTLGSAEIEEVVLEDSANLRVNGNQHATEITGNAGSNILISAGGGDTLTGGDGTDYFAFLISDAGGATRITDFACPNQLALDDRFFGLGDGSINVRAVTQAQVGNALRNTAVQYNRRTDPVGEDQKYG